MKQTTPSRNEAEKRSILQNLFDKSFREGDRESVRKHYKTLRTLELRSENFNTGETADISFIAENITAACDIICSESEKSFVYCGNSTPPAAGSARLIEKALLGLLSNAYLYGAGSLVTVKTLETDNSVQLEIRSGGRFRFNNDKYGGLAFVRKVCREYGGRFLVITDILSAAAVMEFPKSPSGSKVSRSPDFLELISDRLSPVYVEFFGMEYH